MKKLVSIIIPTYKRRSISRAIDSILKQTYDNYEIIVVDDNDPESSYRRDLEKMMAAYENYSNIKYMKHEKNKNGAAARNTGLKIARGEYVGFLDDDDYYLPKRIERLVDALEKAPIYDAAFSSTIFINNEKIIDLGRALSSGQFEKELLMGKFQIFTGSNLFFSRESILDIGGFDESFLRHQDFEVMIRFFKKYKILAVDEYLVVKNSDDRSNIPQSDKLYEIKKNFFKKFEENILLMNDEERKCFYRDHYLNLLRNAVKNKNKEVYLKAQEEFTEISTLDFKAKLILFLEKLNLKFKILDVKYFYQNLRFKRTLNEELIELVKLYEKM